MEVAALMGRSVLESFRGPVTGPVNAPSLP
jgi:hypothetical protein